MLGVCAVVCLGMPVFGQSGTGSGIGTGLGTGAGQHTRQPYTAKFKTTSVQTLANGTTITREWANTIAIDSAGRRLTETTTPATGRSPELSSFYVFDPVARTTINWTVPGKKVTVRPMPPPREPGQAGPTCWTSGMTRGRTVAVPSERPTGAAATPVGGGGDESEMFIPAPARVSIEPTKEDLGTRTIQGVVAKGFRMTSTTPPGAIGNDAPLVRTEEIWAAKPGLEVRHVTDDPRTGKVTKELTELNLGEPDAATFQLPEGYEVVTEELVEMPCAQ